MSAPRVRCAVDSRCLLGEGPVWDVETGDLWWVDIKGRAINRHHPANNSTDRWEAPSVIGALALRESGGLVLATGGGFAFYDVAHGRLASVATPDADIPGNRMNDGKCDRMGRFWAGSMDDGEAHPTGHLYRLDPNLRATRFEAAFVVTNGMDWSGDGAILYFTDSVERTIWAYDFDMAGGTPGARRLFARVAEDGGFPDGLCVDAEDHVWSAHWNGGRVTRYRPDGSVERVVAIPAPLTTSCCFGGDDLDRLYVTTATIGMDDAQLAASPQAGGLFEVAGLGVRGRPMARFAG